MEQVEFSGGGSIPGEEDSRTVEQAPACLLQRWDLGAKTSEGNLSVARGRDEALYMDRLYGLNAGNHSHV